MSVSDAQLDALVAQGLQLQQQGEFQQAERVYAHALQIQPKHPGALHFLGTLAHQFGKHALAIDLIQQALAQREEFGMHFNLGMAFYGDAQTDRALEQFERALALNPGWPLALNAKGVALLDSGRPQQAAACFKEAAIREPGWDEPRSNYLLSRLYDPCATPAEIASEHVSMMRREPSVALSNNSVPVRMDRESRSGLQLGFVSGDLRTHPVGLLIEGLLPELVQRGVDIYVYSTHSQRDAVTQRIQAHAAAWRYIAQFPDDQAAALIRGDDLDVLFDLSGHSAHNRLGVFRHRAAPVQITWLGYGATTGLSDIDFILLDRFSFDPGDEALYAERPLVLRHTRLFYTPPQTNPELVPPPALEKGHVTFGCFNNLAKINSGVAQSWGDILRQLPTARLLLKGRQLDQAGSRMSLVSLFQQAGVDMARVDLEGYEARDDYFSAYARVDIALDPFPFPGGTTTLDGLWMGVPVVTLTGQGLIARQGVSILSNLELAGWIASTEADYVAKAVQKATDLDGLSVLRSTLRQRLSTSPLCDPCQFADDFLCQIRSALEQVDHLRAQSGLA